MQALVNSFEGSDVTTLIRNGRPAWRASEIAAALGYARSNNLGDLIRSKWSEDFVEGADHDLDLPPSEGLTALGRQTPPLLTAQPDQRRGGRPGLILYESGLWLALMKTEKPAGARLRRWLASEVLPELRSTGMYAMASPATVARADDMIEQLRRVVREELEAVVIPSIRREVLGALDVRRRQLALFDELPAIEASSPEAKLICAWLDECCQRGEHFSAQTARLWSSLVAMCIERNVPAPSAKRLGIELARHGFRAGKGRSSERTWTGLKLKGTP